MVYFFQTGGIGDAILGSAIIKELIDIYGQIGALCFNPLAKQVLDAIPELSSVHLLSSSECRSMDDIKKSVPNCDMVVFNKFRRDHNGELNFFCPISEKYFDDASRRRELYIDGIRKKYPNVESISDINTLSLLKFFNGEKNYFSDWLRYGINVSYDNVRISIPQDVIDRNSRVREIGDFAILHDSKYPNNRGETIYLMKSWYGVEWSKLSRYLSDHKLEQIQITNDDQELFSSSIRRQSDIIGNNATFLDYLYMLTQCKLYVGTDSWPAHAAIFINGPKYIILKGAVSMRWDHDGKYSTIIRKGICQACEGPPMSASKCIWRDGEHQCMSLITCNDVVGKIENTLRT